MKIPKIIARARKMGRISKAGVVLCDNCDNPASKSLSTALSWTCCAPCVTGESDSLDFDDLIAVEDQK